MTAQFDTKYGVDPADPILGYDPATEVWSKTVEIDAPAMLVWDILVDLPHYVEWNPSCIRAESTLALGAPVDMWLRQSWDPVALWQAREIVCAFEPGRLLSWQMEWSEGWPYVGRRDQVITSLGPKRCSYYSTDAFLGETGIHVMRFAGPWVKAGFDVTADALKLRAEELYQRSAGKAA